MTETVAELKISPIDFAVDMGNRYAQQVSQSDKKGKGQFFTPKDIAVFMAAQCSLPAKKNIRVLDPGCGTAILTYALLERLTSGTDLPDLIEVVLYETDAYLIKYLEETIKHAKAYYLAKGVTLIVSLHVSDFVLSNAVQFRSEIPFVFEQEAQTFDYIIANPPYFKLAKEDDRSKAAQHVMSGQLNIYSLFMAVSAKLLDENGEMVFITPRSFTAGKYFESFRNFILDEVNITFTHLFASRKDTFGHDNVLQETLIIKAQPHHKQKDRNGIVISTSTGIKDLHSPTQKNYALSELIDFSSKEKIFHIPVSNTEDRVLHLFKSWKHTLQDYGLNISTGPVVAHRLRDSILDDDSKAESSPLIWMHHINKMKFDFGLIKPNKGQFLVTNLQSKPYLLENKNYVLLRRFSAKDDRHRLISSPYVGGFLKGRYIGVENKLNYLYKSQSELSETESFGLSALLNSSIFDVYFRTFNGNVNVSASELRVMTMPSYEQIIHIGNMVINLHSPSVEQIDEIVEGILDFQLK